MADFTNFTKTNLIHHVFSKSPVSPTTPLALARNKSGHTVTSDDVFGEEIPACYEVSTDAQRNALKGNRNDLCVMKNGSSTQRCFYYDNKDNLWHERTKWQDNELFFNSKSSLLNNGTDWNKEENKTQAESDKVIKFHSQREGYYIRTNNNNFLDGNYYTVRVLKNPESIDKKVENWQSKIKSGDFVQSFLSPTDKIVDGIPSNGYNVLLWSDGILITEDAVSDTAYIANNYAGIIQFQKSMQETGTSEYVIPNKTISVWEYVGKTLTEVLNNLPTTGFKYEVIEKLPEIPTEDSMGCIYLVLASKEDENNIYNEFICNKKGEGENAQYEWEQIGSTAITLPKAGQYLKLENDAYSVKTSDTIKDESGLAEADRTVPTTQAVYKHTSDAEVHIPSASAAGSYNGSQTVEGESCHGFILNTNENTRIESIIIVQTNKLGAQWNNNVYCKITDPITDREFISPKFEAVSGLPHSAIYFVKDGEKAEGVNEVPYLVKGRDYKLTFWSSDTHEPISINVPYIEPHQTPNAHFGKFITHRILLSGEVVECSYPDIAASPYGIQNAFKAAGYTIIPKTRRCDNVHFLDFANEIANVYDAIGSDNSANEDLQNHINDTDIHFSYKNIQDYSNSITTFDNCDPDKCYVGTDSGKGEGVFAIEYSKTHFVSSALIKKITIPYDNASGTGISSNSCNLVLEVFKKSNDVTPSNIFFSSNTDTYTESKNEYSFTFDNLILPDDYAFVRISITSQISTDADGNKTRTGYEKFRIIPLRKLDNDSKDELQVFEEDDECKVYWSYSNNTLSQPKNFVANFIAEYQTIILHKNNNERHVTQEEKDRWNRIGNLKAGIDIGTKDNSFDDDDDTSGFLKNVSKLNFKGAFVNVIQKDDGTVDLWINPDNNLGNIDAASSSFTAPTATTSKYVFGGTGYTLPATTGTSFARCHAVENDPTVTLKGKKEGKVDTVFSIGNITSQIKAVVYDKAGKAKATCTTNVIKSGVATKNENGIKITIGSVKEYTEADAEGGFVPGTVSLSCSVTPDISAIFGEGNTWSMKVFLVNGDSEEELYSSETYYAYTTKAATISANPSVVLKGTAQYRWVSGVKYIAKGTEFNVTYGSMSNTTYMIAPNATKRGTIGLTSCGSSDISGTANDTCSTVISGATKTFTLDDDTTARTYLTATHTAISEGGNAEKTATYNGAVWSTGTEDTYNTAYFEREDSPNNGYGRIVGHIDNGTLVINSTTFDSTQALSGNTAKPEYNNQAKVYNGTLVYGEGSGDKYYVRKFKKSTSSTAGLLNMILTAPGRVMNGTNMEIWYYPASNLTFGRRIDATTPPNGIGAASGTNDIIVTVPTTVPLKENNEFYIVVVLKNSNGKITADMKIS